MTVENGRAILPVEQIRWRSGKSAEGIWLAEQQK